MPSPAWRCSRTATAPSRLRCWWPWSVTAPLWQLGRAHGQPACRPLARRQKAACCGPLRLPWRFTPSGSSSTGSLCRFVLLLITYGAGTRVALARSSLGCTGSTSSASSRAANLRCYQIMRIGEPYSLALLHAGAVPEAHPQPWLRNELPVSRASCCKDKQLAKSLRAARIRHAPRLCLWCAQCSLVPSCHCRQGCTLDFFHDMLPPCSHSAMHSTQFPDSSPCGLHVVSHAVIMKPTMICSCDCLRRWPAVGIQCGGVAGLPVPVHIFLGAASLAGEQRMPTNLCCVMPCTGFEVTQSGPDDTHANRQGGCGLWSQAPCDVQVIKIAVPIFNGAKYQCERLPRAAVALALKQYQDHHEAAAAAEVFSLSADARADAPRLKAAPAGVLH